MMMMASCGTGVAYSSRNVLADPELREAIKKFSSWPTIPQVLSCCGLQKACSLFMEHDACHLRSSRCMSGCCCCCND